MVRTTPRTARVAHRCDAHYYPRTIQRGERYLEKWVSPNHDLVGRGVWWRIRVCEDCVADNSQPDDMLLLLGATSNADEERTALEFEGVSS